MPSGRTAPYRYRPLVADDYHMLADWFRQPHMTRWWGDPADALKEVEAAVANPSVDPFIVEFEDRPIAYFQSYDPHGEAGHPYADQPPGTLGFDLSIGIADLLGAGHGSAILGTAVEHRFGLGMPSAIIDPEPDNLRAVRAYRKAGFEPLGQRTTIYGEVLLMRRDAPKTGWTQ